jgi:hypothetical protein
MGAGLAEAVGVETAVEVVEVEVEVEAGVLVNVLVILTGTTVVRPEADMVSSEVETWVEIF